MQPAALHRGERGVRARRGERLLRGGAEYKFSSVDPYSLKAAWFQFNPCTYEVIIFWFQNLFFSHATCAAATPRA